MFEKEEVRLTGIRVKALQRESDEAWAEQVGMASREGWIWHSKEKEWQPAYTQHTSAEEEEGSSDEEMPHIDWAKQDISSGSEDEAMERAWLWREWLLFEGLGRNHLLMSTRPRPNGCVIRSRLLQL